MIADVRLYKSLLKTILGDSELIMKKVEIMI